MHSNCLIMTVAPLCHIV